MSDKEYPALRKGSPHSPQGVLLGTPSFFDNLPRSRRRFWPMQLEGGQFCPQPAFSRLWPPKKGGCGQDWPPSNATSATGCNMQSKKRIRPQFPPHYAMKAKLQINSATIIN